MTSPSRLDPATSSPAEATAENPNEGALVIVVDSQGVKEEVQLSKALHWTEAGRHYISSTEFQVSSSGETFGEAYRSMLDNLFEEARSLAEAIQAADAAPNEREEALALFARIQCIVEVEEEAERRKEQKVAKRRVKSRYLTRRARVSIRKSRKWQIGPSAPHHSANALRV